MVIFHDYTDLVCKKIIIKKSQIHSEKFRTQEILYKIKSTNKGEYNLEKLYVQTPYLFLRYGPQSYEGSHDSKIVIDLPICLKNNYSPEEENDDDCEYDGQYHEFYQIIKKIHKNLKTKLIKKEKEEQTGDVLDKVKENKKKKRDKYVECLKEKKDMVDKNYTHYHLKTKIHSLNGKPFFKIYHSNKKLNKEQKLRMYHYTRFIIHLESIWFFEDTYGFNWYVVQAEMKLPPVPNSYSFHRARGEPEIDVEVEEEIDYENPVIQKFVKMKKMGIPQPVIENKMRLCGLDPSMLFPKHGSSFTGSLGLMPPPLVGAPVAPPLPSASLGPTASLAPAASLAPPPPPPPPFASPPPLPSASNKPEVKPMAEFRPSLEQLQERLKNLRKVKPEDKKK